MAVDTHHEEQVTCPECTRSWPYASEQAACIHLYGSCIYCKYAVLSKNQLDAIQEVARARGAYEDEEESRSLL